MAFKPGDFFLGVIDFFGILVPGAVLMYLHGDLLLALLGGQPMLDSQVSRWVGFLIGAYVLGQFLLGATVPLNRLLKIFLPEDEDSYYQEVKDRMAKDRIKLPPEPKKPKSEKPEPKIKTSTVVLNWLQERLKWLREKFRSKSKRTAAYHRAYSYLRLCNTAAITEIDRQTAEYKLFRSLVLVSLLDVPLAWTNGSLDLFRAVVMILLAVLALWRFLFLLNWAQRLTFEFYVLLPEAQAAADKA